VRVVADPVELDLSLRAAKVPGLRSINQVSLGKFVAQFL
jgi:hypothetical protein